MLNEIIAAGNAAPSGVNSQMWRFVVIENAEFRKKLAALALPRYKAWLEKMPDEIKAIRQEIDEICEDPAYYSAPAIIFVIGYGMTSALDCPMVCQNIMLSARSLGIGSCWVYIGQLPLDDPEVRESLKLQDHETVYGPILLGYPKDEFPEAPAKKEAEVTFI